MVEPRIVPRDEHPLSRKDIDPDALKVLYRLRQFEHTAYLVGGSVRDLLLGRRPKDFDIGTSRSEEHTSELQSRQYLVCRLLLEKKKKNKTRILRVNSKCF